VRYGAAAVPWYSHRQWRQTRHESAEGTCGGAQPGASFRGERRASSVRGSACVNAVEPATGFAHDALLYAGDAGFVAGAVPFVLDGIEAGEPVLVAVERSKIELLEDALQGDACRVQFADMREVGGNPARLIPVWQQFVDMHAPAGVRVRGIGEPVWAGRSRAEIAECRRHEELLNVAFEPSAPFSLLCPYDTERLDPDVIAGACCSHPAIVAGARRRPSTEWCGVDACVTPFAEPLADPPAGAETLRFGVDDLPAVRAFVEHRALGAGLARSRAEDLVLAVNEVATNSVRHGGGGGMLLAWREPQAVLCEVRDAGRLADPLVGRRRPGAAQHGGYGLWLVNQVCDLVQVRDGSGGAVVRVHMRVP
jgi:anti-sigma regulatory factor (Ser/Thr protein kinase)